MPQFKYSAIDRASQRREGLVEAVDEKQAKQILRERNLLITALNPAKKYENFADVSASFSRITANEISNFTRQLSTMITAGLSLTESLHILKDQSKNPKFVSVVDDITRSIEGGSSFGAALEKHKKVFSHVYIALIKAGEASGLLDNILARLAENLEKAREFRAKTKGALIYPIVVIGALIIVVFIMMVFVIPRLTGMYREMNIELPGPTQFLITISDFSVAYWWLIIAAAVGGIYGFRQYNKTPIGRKTVDTFLLKLPIFGNIRREAALAEIARTLGLLSSAGIPILESLNIVVDASESVLFQEALRKAAKDVEHGFPLSTPVKNNSLFPPLFGQMIKVGEETGKLDEVLLKVANYFESEVENKVKNLTTALEPFILIVLGLAVAFLVISIILPIYRLTTSF